MTYGEKYLKRKAVLFRFVHDYYVSWKTVTGSDITFGEWLDKEIDKSDKEYTVYCFQCGDGVLREETGTLCELRDKFLLELHHGQEYDKKIKTEFKSIIGLVNALNASEQAVHHYLTYWKYRDSKKK